MEKVADGPKFLIIVWIINTKIQIDSMKGKRTTEYDAGILN
jgi:hypothetical protein